MTIQHTAYSVRLRTYSESDVDAVYAASKESVVEISPWMSWCHSNLDRSETEAWVKSRKEAWKRRDAFSFLIEHRGDGTVVGTCGLSHFHWQIPMANLGYWVRTSRTGKGYASAAVRLLADWGFRHWQLARIEIVAGIGNKASQAVARKVGAREEGILRNRLRVGERLLDAYLYSLLPEESRL